jgi:hypothetical protein
MGLGRALGSRILFKWRRVKVSLLIKRLSKRSRDHPKYLKSSMLMKQSNYYLTTKRMRKRRTNER